jgi:TPR repeat protein
LKYHREGDHEGAARYLLKAAGLGDIDAHWNLAGFYDRGEGVEKDEKRELYHLEEAAIGGHPQARFNLGWQKVMEIEGCNGAEWKSGFDRAVKHFIIAANLGLDNALDLLKKYFAVGAIYKEVYEAALRGHQAAVDATKSTQREEAYAFDEMCEAKERAKLRGNND